VPCALLALESTPMYQSPPRPILKRTVSHTSSSPPHAVHFPPSPSLTRTFTAHSSSYYDRSPIEVAPNTCALPARGCPGRTYNVDDVPPCPPKNPPRGHPYGGRDLHPRAFAMARTPATLYEDAYEDPQRTPTGTFYQLPPPPPVPALIPDFSSESDESDSFISPLPSSYVFPPPPPSGNKYPAHYSQYPAHPINPASLAFLPHAPSPHVYSPARSEEAQQKTRRHRERRRSRSRSRERDYRIRSAAFEEEDAYDEDDERSGTPTALSSSPKQRISRDKGRDREKERRKSLPLCKALSSFTIDDVPCLGGF